MFTIELSDYVTRYHFGCRIHMISICSGDYSIECCVEAGDSGSLIGINYGKRSDRVACMHGSQLFPDQCSQLSKHKAFV